MSKHRRRRLLLESLEAKCLLAADGPDFDSDMIAEGVGELIELQIDATRDGQSILDSNREFTATVGERFDLEVRYDDLRTLGDEIGAFGVYTDIASSLPETVRPVVTETQFFTLGNIGDATGGDLVFSVEGNASDHTVSFNVYGSDPIGSVEAALTAIQLTDFTVEETVNGADRTYMVRFHGEDAKLADIGNVSVDVSQLTGATVSFASEEVPALLASGKVNSDAIRYNVNIANPTFNNGEDFYLHSVTGELSETDFLVDIGGFGLVSSGGVPGLTDDGSFTQPFYVFSMEIEVVDVASSVEFSVSPAASNDEAILLYGRDNAVSEDLVLLDADASFVAKFTSDDTVHTNPDQPEDVNADGNVSGIDALLVLNRIFIHGELPVTSGPSFFDVNGDGQLTAVDANRVMTYLATQTDDFNIVDTANLISLNLDVQRDGDTILPPTGETLELNVGERFDLTVRYEDNRSLSADTGAMSFFADIATNKPDTFRPVVSETQQLIFSLNELTDPNAVNVVFKGDSPTISHEISVSDFGNNPQASVVEAATELGITGFEISSMTLPDSDQLGYQLRFTTPFEDQPNLTATVTNSVAGPTNALTIEIPALNDGVVNPEALKYNIKNESASFNNGGAFYTISDTAAYEPSGDSVFSEVGGIGGVVPTGGGGIPELTGQGLASPFDAFSIEIEVLSAADGVTFEVARADLPENQIVLYGIDNHLSSDQVNQGNGFRVELDFVAAAAFEAGNGTLTLDEDSSESVDLASLVSGGTADIVEIVTDGTSGTAVISGTTLTYTPTADFFGSDTVTYRATNAAGATDTGTINVTVDSVNDVPVAGTDEVRTEPGEVLEIGAVELLGNDNAGPGEADQVLTVTDVSTSDDNLAVEIVDGTIVLTPADDFAGTGAFEYTLSDGIDTAVGTVDVIVEFSSRPITLELESDDDLSLIVRANGDNLEIHDVLLDQELLRRPISETESLSIQLSGEGSHLIRLEDGSLFSFPVDFGVAGEGVDRLVVADTNSDLIEVDAFNATRIADLITIEHTEVESSSYVNALGFESLEIEAIQQIVFATDLAVGADELILNAELPIDLPQLTSIDGGTLVSSSTIAVSSGHSLLANGTIDARVAAEVGSLIRATGDLTMGDADSVAGFETRGDLEVAGNTLQLLDANQAAVGAITSLGTALDTDDAAPGTLVAANGLIVDFSGNVVGFGAIDSPNDEALVLLNNGEFAGASVSNPLTLSGYVKGVGSFDKVVVNGTFSPGLSPTITENGTVTYGPNSEIVIELGGILAGDGFDQINHSAIASLAGSLLVELIDGFVPSGGERYTIVTAAESLINELSDLQLPALSDGLQWIIDQTGNEITLEVGVDLGQLIGGIQVEIVDGKLVVRDSDGEIIPTNGTSIRIDVKPSDEFENTAGFQVTETAVVEGEFVQRVASGDSSLEIFGSNWTNFVNPADVDGSGDVTARDALLIINNLPRPLYYASADTLVDPATIAEFPGYFFDVSGDGRGSSLDALRVINRVGESASGESEQLVLVPLANSSVGSQANASDSRTDVAPEFAANSSVQRIASFTSNTDSEVLAPIAADLAISELNEEDSVDGIDELAANITSAL